MANRFCDFLNRVNMINNQSSRKRKFYKKRFRPYIDLSDNEFRIKYRFSKKNMQKLISLVEEDLKGDNRGGTIPPDLQVMAAIRYWGRNEIQDDSSDIHGFSQSTLSNISARVSKAFASKARQYIKMPQTSFEQIQIMEEFKKIRGFPQVIGAIDCTHIKIPRQGGESGQYYVNRKGYFSINVQAVCDANLKIRDIVCHWRGSTHDSRIFGESSIKDRLHRGEFRGRLLGDGGYGCTNWLFTPVQNPANHSEENYNIAHIATRNTIERTFGVWKSRFRILLTGMRGSLENIKTTVVALAVLHNLAIEYNDTLDFEDRFLALNNDEVENDNQLLPQVQDTSRRAFIATYFS